MIKYVSVSGSYVIRYLITRNSSSIAHIIPITVSYFDI